jgi:uncharacterized protein (TIGR03382 family)
MTMRLARLVLPAACLGLALAAAPAHADVVFEDSGQETDSGGDDDEDKDGCSAVPLTPTSALSVGVGLALLAVLRRRQR